MLNVVAVSRRWARRYGRGGYERLLEFVPFLNVISMERRFVRPYRVMKWLANHSGNKAYSSISSGLETSLLASGRWMLRTGAHYLYGDYDYCFSGKLLASRCAKVSITLHNPESELRKRIGRNDYFRHVNGVIVLGSNLVDYASRAAPSARIAVIPHGVDCSFFCPNLNSSREKTAYSVLLVGMHLRDWHWTRKFLLKLQQSVADVIVNCVLPEHIVGELDGIAIRNHNGICDEALRELYRSAAFLVYVPEDCVASNAVLEAMSCGTPVLGVRRGAVEEYVGSEGGILVNERHLDDLVAAAVQVIRDSDFRNELGRSARRRAEVFDWQKIGARVIEFLGDVHD